MKNLFYFLTMLFSGMCFISAQYVFFTGGEANTTLSIVFLVFAYATSYGYKSFENKKKLIAKAA